MKSVVSLSPPLLAGGGGRCSDPASGTLAFHDTALPFLPHRTASSPPAQTEAGTPRFWRGPALARPPSRTAKTGEQARALPPALPGSLLSAGTSVSSTTPSLLPGVPSWLCPVQLPTHQHLLSSLHSPHPVSSSLCSCDQLFLACTTDSVVISAASCFLTAARAWQLRSSRHQC